MQYINFHTCCFIHEFRHQKKDVIKIYGAIYGSFSYKQSSPLTPRNLLSSSPSENLLKVVKNYKILDKKFYYPQSIVSISGSVCPNVCPSV